ncbi:peptide-methionine (S)-S-oxide reductase [Mucilaginibacter sp. JRF]|nr:peptide-methionine (S)-S-oxide reductase [Mucilaginibacter sp. JRF]
MELTGFGGSCHWCTEAIFRSLRGVEKVEQGWIATDGDGKDFSEAVIVHYEPAIISLPTLIEVHLYTHSCTAQHSMRDKYRSAIYTFNDTQSVTAKKAINDLQAEFKEPIITKVIPFGEFKLNEEQYLDYYYRDPDKPFCRNIIYPKLQLLLRQFGDRIGPGIR